MTESTQDERSLAPRAVAQARPKLREIQAIFKTISTDLSGDRFWRYQYNVSPGLQEYIEALSFSHYLEFNSLISYDEVLHTLSDVDGPVCLVDSSHLSYRIQSFQQLLVFPTARLRLSPRPLRSHRRAYALCNFLLIQTRRPLQGIRG